MRTRRELGKLLFGNPGSASMSSQSRYSPKQASVQRGTLSEETFEQDGRILASILIDGDENPGRYTVDMHMHAGQRVVLLFFGGQALVLPISSLILGQAASTAGGMIQDAKTELETEIEQAGEQIKKDAVQESTASVDGKLQENKAEIEQWVADTYQSKSDMGSYATTSALKQTSEEITATFTQSLNAKGKTYVGQPSPPYSAGDVWIDPAEGISYTCTSSRSSGGYQESDWEEHDAFVSAFVRSDYDGVTVGKSESGWMARISTRGTFDVLNDSGRVVAQFGQSSSKTYVTTQSGGIEMRDVLGAAVVSCGDEQVVLSAMQGAYSNCEYITLPTASSTNYTKLFGSTILYSNDSGTQGSFVLSVSAERYAFIDFVYGDGTRMMASRVFSPNGKTTSLARTVYSSSGGQLHFGANVYSVSGTSVSILPEYSAQAWVGTNGECAANPSGNLLRVYQVIGWR